MDNSGADQVGVRAALGTLEALELAAALLSPGGRVLGATPAMKALVGIAKFDGKALKWRCPKTDSAYRSGILAIGTQRRDTVIIRSSPKVADGYKICIRELPELMGGSILVTFTRAELKVPDPGVLETIFDLTSAEANVLGQIGRGRTPRKIAAASNVSLETVRSHLKAVMRKTGASRQAELVAMIAAHQ